MVAIDVTPELLVEAEIVDKGDSMDRPTLTNGIIRDLVAATATVLSDYRRFGCTSEDRASMQAAHTWARQMHQLMSSGVTVLGE